MAESDWLAEGFEQNRTRLRAVAYRMLGSLAEADDAVQNSWLRLSRADPAEVENLAGWLTTVVARECLKMMRARRSRREEPLADITAEPPAGRRDVSDPEAEALLADSVGPALMVVLDILVPAERLAFVLHDIFAVPFDEIAVILERSPAAARQLAIRARRRVRGATPPPSVDLGRQRRVVDAFLAALRGARAVGSHALGFSRSAQFVEPALVNGAVGLAIVPQGRLMGALGFTFSSGRITEIDMISEPGRLRDVDLAAPGP